MLYGMSTIEIIENLIIENLTENRVIRRSDDRRRIHDNLQFQIKPCNVAYYAMKV